MLNTTEEKSLLDIFMPEDLCARCNLLEPENEFALVVENGQEICKLHFCSAKCKQIFANSIDLLKQFG